MIYGAVNMQLLLRPNVFGNGGWASVSNTYWVTSDEPVGLELIAEFTSAAEHLFNNIRPYMGGPDIYCMVHYRPRHGSTFPDGVDEVALADGGYVEAAPWWASLMVKKFTGDPARYKKGRAYLPFIGLPLGQKPLVSETPNPLPGLADAFAETILSGTMQLVPVVYNSAAGVYDSVVKCEVSQFLAFQRRRNASTRYYEFP